MSSGRLREPAGRFLAAVLLSLVFTGWGDRVAAGEATDKAAAKAAVAQAEGRRISYYSGDRQVSLWMAADELAVLPTAGNDGPTVAAAAVRGAGLTGTVLEQHPNVVVYRVAGSLVGAAAKVQKAGGTLTSPVFYPTADCSRGRTMLTGQLIVHFKDGWTAAQVATWAAARGLTPVKSFDFAPTVWVLAAADPLASLEAANAAYESGEVIYAYPNWLCTAKACGTEAPVNDPYFYLQWHLQNTGQFGGTAGEDANVVRAWTGYRGTTESRIVVVDTGIERKHEDLLANMAYGHHWDFVLDVDPMEVTGTTYNAHGTQVAGVIGAVGNNGLGVCGVLSKCYLFDHRLFDTVVAQTSVAHAAEALTRNLPAWHISNNSWSLENGLGKINKLEPVEELALKRGVTAGRSGRGVIYVFAAGDNGMPDKGLEGIVGFLPDQELSTYDGFPRSRYVIAVGGTDNYGQRMWEDNATSGEIRSERGPNVLVNAPTNGGSARITTTTTTTDTTNTSTNVKGPYTTEFRGTSASVAIVSGIVGLMLQANPTLTWQDVRQILTCFSNKNDATNSDWKLTAAGGAWLAAGKRAANPGLHFNPAYGFGRVDALAAVNVVQSFQSLGPRQDVVLFKASYPHKFLPDLSSSEDTITFTATDGTPLFVEYIEIGLDVPDHTWWGDLLIEVTSPSGTVSRLTEPHQSTRGDNQLNNARFGTVEHFGESTHANGGVWKMSIKDLWGADEGTWESWSLTVYGRPDTDMDGLPDDWEYATIGDLSSSPGDDPDGDGLDNWEEFKRGTDPRGTTMAIYGLTVTGKDVGAGEMNVKKKGMLFTRLPRDLTQPSGLQGKAVLFWTDEAKNKVYQVEDWQAVGGVDAERFFALGKKRNEVLTTASPNNDTFVLRWLLGNTVTRRVQLGTFVTQDIAMAASGVEVASDSVQQTYRLAQVQMRLNKAESKKVNDFGKNLDTAVRDYMVRLDSQGYDDESAWLEIAAATSVAENAGPALVAVTLHGLNEHGVTVDYTTADISAVAGTDYTATAGTLTWLTGVTGVQNISIPITDDIDPEDDEYVNVELSGVAGANLHSISGTLTITDDDK